MQIEQVLLLEFCITLQGNNAQDSIYAVFVMSMNTCVKNRYYYLE